MIATRRFTLAARIAAARFVPPGSRRRSRARLPAWLPLALRWKMRGKPRSPKSLGGPAVEVRATHTSYAHWHVAGRRRKWPERVNSLPPAIVSVIHTVRESIIKWHRRIERGFALATGGIAACPRSRCLDEFNSVNSEEPPRAMPVERLQGTPLLIREPNNVSTIVDPQMKFTGTESTRGQPNSFRKRASRFSPAALALQTRRTPRAESGVVGLVAAMPIASLLHGPEHTRRSPQSKFWRKQLEVGHDEPSMATVGAMRRSGAKAAITSFSHQPDLVSRRAPRSKEWRKKLEAGRDERKAVSAGTARHSMAETVILPLRHAPDLVWRAPHATKLRTSVDIDNSDTSRRTAGSPHAGGTVATLQEKARPERVTTLGRMTSLDPALVDRLADDVIRRIERQMRIERERCGL